MPTNYRSLFDLTGRVAIVTGGLGILGRHFCTGLADCGAKVAVVDLDETEASRFAAELSARSKTQCYGVGTDIRDPGAVEAMVTRVEEALGPVDILHNNAATKGHDLKAFFTPPEEYSLDVWREVMAVNLDGLFLVAQAVGKRMAQRRKGSIIQTSSIYGVMGPDSRIYEGSEYMGVAINTPPVYSASKAGVVGLTKYLATHWAAHGVRVNTLTPGGVGSGQNGVFQTRYANRIPMARMASAEEMVGALIFLASDASSYVTGQNIIVDGGLSAW
ncbi:SDR family oxidoreductase [Magnetospirillum fulvum]|uniref:NAD(P)-dependent dehydrogenase, short-chain alcohol dehydrogenase family n=1 Tax=Magnetospirillum fulvum TaxID=1082 RepID=A0A1H6J436_MAGFU|nr:SDR family oxidoreductase [Magnetospirillum fulvum]SEH53702.1 NAD(P)-dependent dehydrogenase, short-chain alcohol dehydrogenase family [Magnetospirillum fulvum]